MFSSRRPFLYLWVATCHAHTCVTKCVTEVDEARSSRSGTHNFRSEPRFRSAADDAISSWTNARKRCCQCEHCIGGLLIDNYWYELDLFQVIWLENIKVEQEICKRGIKVYEGWGKRKISFRSFRYGHWSNTVIGCFSSIKKVRRIYNLITTKKVNLNWIKIYLDF